MISLPSITTKERFHVSEKYFPTVTFTMLEVALSKVNTLFLKNVALFGPRQTQNELHVFFKDIVLSTSDAECGLNNARSASHLGRFSMQ